MCMATAAPHLIHAVQTNMAQKGPEVWMGQDVVLRHPRYNLHKQGQGSLSYSAIPVCSVHAHNICPTAAPLTLLCYCGINDPQT